MERFYLKIVRSLLGMAMSRLWSAALLAGMMIVLLVSVSHAHQSRSSMAGTVSNAGSPVQLTDEEREYLKRIGPVTVCPDPDWQPYSYVDKAGNFTGIAADLLHLLEKRLQISFRYLTVDTWDQAIALSQSGKVMLLYFPFSTRPPNVINGSCLPILCLLTRMFLLPGQNIRS